MDSFLSWLLAWSYNICRVRTGAVYLIPIISGFFLSAWLIFSGSTLASAEGSLLLTLKQVNQDFSTIQFKELNNFNERTLQYSSENDKISEALSDSTGKPPLNSSKLVLPAKKELSSDDKSYPDDLYEFDGKAFSEWTAPLLPPHPVLSPSGREGQNKGSLSPTGREGSIKRSLETQASIAEFYNDRMRELAELQDKVNLLRGYYMNYPEKSEHLRSLLMKADEEKSKFESAWFQQKFGTALSSFEESKAILLTGLFDKVPGTEVEGRAIWLDRGSIVEAGSPEGLRKLIQRIAVSGFNIIYFETVNAGYPIYPSKIVEQNPLIKGWDPLEVAINEAHKQDIELHAWVWVFAVGNIRHNRIVGQPESFPGPILSRPDMVSEALLGKNGEMVLQGQYEYWLSPASQKASDFLISLFSEIVRNYKVDGLQMDYIRYPFQKPNSPMGMEHFALASFNEDTGLYPGDSNPYTDKALAAWKAFKVTSFVRKLSRQLKEINPNLKISAAVFPMARHSRMLAIQQDWETWVRNGWIDTLSPMAYSRSSRSLERLVEYIHNIGEDKALVYPGLSLIKLNAVELLDALEICRKTGVMGTTLFAAAQFDSDKQLLLQTGPYKDRKTILPHRDLFQASSQLISETQAIVTGIIKSRNQQQGLEDLRQIEESLDSINHSLKRLANDNRPLESGYLFSLIRDDSRLLQHRAEQWAGGSDDSVINFQAKILKQMVDKTVRMVNYATYQWSSTTGS